MAPTNKEIIFVLKMRNMARDALRQFGTDATSAGKGANAAAQGADKARDAMGRFVKGANQASGAANKATNALNQFNRAGSGGNGKAVVSLFNNMSKGALEASGRISKLAAGLLGISGGLLAGNGVKQYADFERQMSVFKAVSGASEADMKRVSDAARAMGRDTEFSAGQAAEALTIFAKAGFDTAKAIEATKSTLDLALVGQTDLATAAEITMNVLNQFGLSADKTSAIVDILSKTDNSAAVSITDLGESFKYAGTVANSAGVSINTLSAAFGVLGDAGTKGSMAGTQIQQVISRMLNVTPHAQQALKDLGLTIKDLDPTDLAGTFEKLRKAGMNTGQAIRIFGEEGGRAATVIAAGTQKLRDYQAANEKAGGAAAAAAKEIGNNLTGDVRQLSSALEEAALALGTGGFGAVLRQVVQDVTEAINNFSSWAREIKLTKEQITEAVTWIERVGVVIGALGIAGAIAGFLQLTGVVGGVKIAFEALSLVIANFPLVRLATLLALSLTTLVAMEEKINEIFSSATSYGSPSWIKDLENGEQALRDLDAQIDASKAKIASMKSGKLFESTGDAIGLSAEEALLKDLETRRKLLEEGVERFRKERKAKGNGNSYAGNDRYTTKGGTNGMVTPGSTDTKIAATDPAGGERTTVNPKDTDRISKFNESLRDKLALMREEVSTLGMSDDARARATQLLEVEQQARKAGVTDVKATVDAYAKEYDAIQKIKTAYQNNPMNGIKDGFNSFIDDNKKLADKVKDAWTTALDGVGDSFADLVVDGTNSFGDVAKSFAKSMLSAGFKNIMANIFEGTGVANLFGDKTKTLTAATATVNAGTVNINGAPLGGIGAVGAVQRGAAGSDLSVGSSGIGSDYAASMRGAASSAKNAFLDAIASVESGGKYNIRYGGVGSAGKTFDMAQGHPNILEPTKDGRMSSAAGAYQITGSTYRDFGGGAFDPAGQRNMAWRIAEQRSGLGSGLEGYLQKNGLDRGMINKLGPTWQGFEKNPDKAMSTYRQSLGSGGGQDLVQQARQTQQQVQQIQTQGMQQQVNTARQTQTQLQATTQQTAATTQQAGSQWGQLSSSVQQAGNSAGMAAPKLASVGTQAQVATPSVGNFGAGVGSLLGPLSSAIPGLGQFSGVISSVIGALGQSGGAAGGGGLNLLSLIGLGHSGAKIGEWTTGSKAVSPAVFAGARRFHTGGKLGADEVPFIGLKGERVLNREETKAYEAGSVTGGMSGARSSGAGGVAIGSMSIPISIATQGSSGDRQKDEEHQRNMSRQVGAAVDQHMTEWFLNQSRPGGLLTKR